MLRPGFDPSGLIVVSEDPAIEGGDRDVDAGRPEIGDEDVPGIGAEGQLARRAPAGARPDITFADEPAIDELTDALRHDRTAQARSGNEFRP
jgi:hypothetical protein